MSSSFLVYMKCACELAISPIVVTANAENV